MTEIAFINPINIFCPISPVIHPFPTQSDATTLQLRKKKIAIEDDVFFRLPGDRTDRMTHRSARSSKNPMRMSFYEVKEAINEHIEDIHTNITENAVRTIKFVQKSSSKLVNLIKRPLTTSHRTAKQLKLNPALHAVSQLWDEVAVLHESDSSEYPRVLRYQEAPKMSSESMDDSRLRNKYQDDDMKDVEIERISIDTKLDFEGWRRKRQISRQGAKGMTSRKVIV